MPTDTGIDITFERPTHLNPLLSALRLKQGLIFVDEVQDPLGRGTIWRQIELDKYLGTLVSEGRITGAQFCTLYKRIGGLNSDLAQVLRDLLEKDLSGTRTQLPKVTALHWVLDDHTWYQFKISQKSETPWFRSFEELFTICVLLVQEKKLTANQAILLIQQFFKKIPANTIIPVHARPLTPFEQNPNKGNQTRVYGVLMGAVQRMQRATTV